MGISTFGLSAENSAVPEFVGIGFAFRYPEPVQPLKNAREMSEGHAGLVLGGQAGVCPILIEPSSGLIVGVRE
jgi:hypothetical protein